MIKKIILKTTLISIPLIVILFCLELTLGLIPNDYKYKANYLNKNAEKIEILILGSSHSFFGVDPAYFSGNAFNVGYKSQSLDYDYEILSKHKESFDKLKTVYIPISYSSLFFKLKDGEKWRCKKYYHSYGITKDLSFKDYFEISHAKMGKNIKTAFNYIVKKKNKITCNKLGWGMNYKAENTTDLEKTGRDAAKRHHKSNFKNSEKNFEDITKMLNDIIKWSKQKDIKIIFFTTPTFKSYRENLDKEQLDITVKTMEEIASKHKSCFYTNMIADTNFVAEDFFDADHLSEKGAKKLSIKLNTMYNLN